MKPPKPMELAGQRAAVCSREAAYIDLDADDAEAAKAGTGGLIEKRGDGPSFPRGLTGGTFCELQGIVEETGADRKDENSWPHRANRHRGPTFARFESNRERRSEGLRRPAG